MHYAEVEYDTDLLGVISFFFLDEIWCHPLTFKYQLF